MSQRVLGLALACWVALLRYTRRCPWFEDVAMGFIYSLMCLAFVSVVAIAREVSHCPAQLLYPAV